MTKDEALKLALEALELANYQICDYCGTTLDEIEEAITALSQAIEQAEKQEHVIDCPRCGHCCPQTPPRQPLTDEEIKHIEETTTCMGDESWLRNLTRAIEAAHGIKE